MGVISDYAEYDAVGLAELVSRREVTPLELVDEAIRRIEQVNPELNAVTVGLYDQGRKQGNSNDNLFGIGSSC